MFHWKQFTTPPTIQHVKAHHNNPNNDAADTLAKEAAIESITLNINPRVPESDHQTEYPLLPQMPPDILADHTHTYLYHENNLIEKYPAHFIKDTFQISQNNESKTNLIKQHPHIPDIEFQDTISLINLLTKPYLNCTRINDLKFRSQLIFKKLSLKDDLYEWNITSNDQCPLCKTETETLQHLTTCPYLLAHYQTIYAETIKILQSTYYKTDPNNPIIALTMRHFGMRQPTFFNYPLSSGIITAQDVKNIKDIYKTNKLHVTGNKTQKSILTHIADAWLTALYTTIWSKRNNILAKQIEDHKRAQAIANPRPKTKTPTSHLSSFLTQPSSPIRQRHKKTKRNRKQQHILTTSNLSIPLEEADNETDEPYLALTYQDLPPMTPNDPIPQSDPESPITQQYYKKPRLNNPFLPASLLTSDNTPISPQPTANCPPPQHYHTNPIQIPPDNP